LADDGHDGIYDGKKRLIDRADAERPGTLVLLENIMCPGAPPCPTRIDDVMLRWDGSHLTPPGSQWLGSRLLRSLERGIPGNDMRSLPALR
jgi:hypothetical protein